MDHHHDLEGTNQATIGPVPHELAHEGMSPCPTPLAHDRIIEAHFFWHQSAKTYHQPDLFRFHLSALLNGLVGTRNMLLRDFADQPQELEWVVAAIEAARAASPSVTWSIELRNTLVHESRLLQQSSVSYGAFRWFGVPKLALGTATNPFMSTQEIADALLQGHNEGDNTFDFGVLTPDEDQYFGLTRRWMLPIDDDPTELLAATRESLQWLRGIVVHLHQQGAQGEVEPHALPCEENLVQYHHVPLLWRADEDE